MFAVACAYSCIGGVNSANKTVLPPSQYNSTSNVNGDNVTNYFTLDVSLSSVMFPNTDVTYWTSYDYGGNRVNQNAISSNVLTPLTTLSTLNMIGGFNTDYAYVLRYASLNNNNEKEVTMRVIVPSSWQYIYNIEFCLTGTFNYATFNFNVFTNSVANGSSYTNINGAENSLNWFGFTRSSINTTAVSSTSDVDGFMFYDYGINFVIDAYDYNFKFNFLGSYSNSSQYTNAFNDGYSSGYNQGTHDGYAEGYGEALSAVSYNGNFNALFNSVADTPLRFLYGLFSFDLFGTSCLMIILSLLTAIFMFGLIKKIWK